MTLRIMLLGLVASMGFELPSGPEVSRRMQSGRDWVLSMLADPSGPLDGPSDCRQADAPALIGPSAPDDAAFVAATEAMAAEFAADLMTPPGEDVPPMLAGEPPAVGLPDGEEVALLATPEEEVGPAEVVETDDVSCEESDEPPSRADRVSSAIRLTREAARAWADLIQEPAEDDSPTR